MSWYTNLHVVRLHLRSWPLVKELGCSGTMAVSGERSRVDVKSPQTSAGIIDMATNNQLNTCCGLCFIPHMDFGKAHFWSIFDLCKSFRWNGKSSYMIYTSFIWYVYTNINDHTRPRESSYFRFFIKKLEKTGDRGWRFAAWWTNRDDFYTVWPSPQSFFPSKLTNLLALMGWADATYWFCNSFTILVGSFKKNSCLSCYFFAYVVLLQGHIIPPVSRAASLQVVV